MNAATKDTFERDIRAIERKIEFAEGRLEHIREGINRASGNEQRAIFAFEASVNPRDRVGRPEEQAVHLASIRNGLAHLHQVQRHADVELAELRGTLDALTSDLQKHITSTESP